MVAMIFLVVAALVLAVVVAALVALEPPPPPPRERHLGPMDLYLSSGKVPSGRTAEILRLAQESHDARSGTGLTPEGQEEMKFQVEVTRSITTTVEVEAGSAAEAAAKVSRADYPLPPRDEWYGHKDWSIDVVSDEEEDGQEEKE